MFHKLSLLSLIILSTVSLCAVDISGKISYERILPLHTGALSRLDSSNISTESAKEVLVEAIDSTGSSLASTYTDSNGNYSFTGLSQNTNLKIRVYAKMLKSSAWDVEVIDNTNSYALYVIEGSLATTGSSDSIRNLTASSSDKSSPPFAILDSVREAMLKVLAVDSSVVFPTLKMNWSINNVESGTYYDGTDNIMLQGDQDGDSDEYDDHIIIHEWGHFFENKLSRADNIGGQHGANEHLDIRVAFGEGFGNALSAIVTDDPVYYDTYNSTGWNMNIEEATHETPGWFSEASVQRILYDLYDSDDDGDDTLSLGFKPLYDVLIGGQKNTEAFTSIFSFVTELKNENANDTGKIDNIIASENIETIENSYGTDRLNNVDSTMLPLYNQLTLNETFQEICTSSTYGSYNKLNNRKYVRFTITETNSYPIRVEQNNGSSSDPDFQLFKTAPFEELEESIGSSAGIEEKSYTLSTGDYLLDIYDARNNSEACFNVTVGEVTTNGTTSTTETTSSTENGTESGTTTTTSVGVSLPENRLLLLLIMLSIAFIPALFIRKELKKST